MDHLPLLALDHTLLFAHVDEHLQLLLGDEWTAHAATPCGGAYQESRQLGERADDRPQDRGEHGDRRRHDQGQSLVEAQRQGLGRDLAEHEHDGCQHHSARDLRNRMQILIDEDGGRRGRHDHRDRIEREDGRQVSVRVIVQAHHALRPAASFLGEAPHADATHAGQRRLSRRRKRCHDQPCDEDDDERCHAIGDWAGRVPGASRSLGSDPLNGTARSRCGPRAPARSPRRSAEPQRGRAAWAHRRNWAARWETGWYR